MGTGQKKNRVVDPQQARQTSNFKYEVSEEFVDNDEFENAYLHRSPRDPQSPAPGFSKVNAKLDDR